MARFESPFPEARVVPTLGYHLVEPGGVITVPDSEYVHWVAGGWTPLDPEPAAPAAAPAPAAPAVPASDGDGKQADEGTETA